MAEPVHTYEQAIGYLFDRINFERTPANGAGDFKLSRTRQLLEQLDHPQNRFSTVHIAGTKGKGSTAIMLTEILSASGYRVGLYTSPHVEAFEERMQVAHQGPTPAQIVELVRRVQVAVRHCETTDTPFSPTFFEITTAIAWLFFEMQRAEIIILEVGLGGRLDSTNVCSPIACVLTTISRDHVQLLGSTLAQIAREKAGIIKPRTPVISGVRASEAREVIAATCKEQNAELWQLDQDFKYTHHPDACEDNSLDDSSFLATNFELVDVTTPSDCWEKMPLTLAGEHQAHNAAVALATVDRLRLLGWNISPEAAKAGLARVRWPMRIEVISRQPTVIVDAGHNWESISALAKTLEASFSPTSHAGIAPRRVLIFAATKDKDVVGILRQLLPRFDTVILTQYLNNPRAVPPKQLHKLIQSVSDRPCHVTTTPAEAWRFAQRMTTPNDLICVTGSFFIAAEMRELILRNEHPLGQPR